MSSLTRSIEKYIHSLLEEEDSPAVSLRRKDLAEQFGCVPSQINYVLRSRFTPEKGFLVESQRGGHGFIRIARITFRRPQERIDHLEEIIGSVISSQEVRRLLTNLQERGILSDRERLLLEVALRFQDEVAETYFDLSPYKRDMLQADLLKRLLRSLALS
jgi:transcriptional regulator CtsR